MSLGIRAAVAVSAARRRKHFWNQRLKESVAKKNRANAWLRWLATKADPDLACSASKLVGSGTCVVAFTNIEPPFSHG